ncbi:MAG: ATP-binding cassette domain-containing protein [Bacteroidota bacterium]
MEAILSLDKVRKSYHKHLAVDNISFDMPKGSIFGLLGPNGAGKTSLIRIITTITQADSGQVYIDGEKLNFDHPKDIGYMPEERGLYKKMKVGEQLMYLAQLKGMEKGAAKAAIKEWMIKFQIEDWWNKKIEELSKGMQQKIQFIATVMHRPKLLILDEPFSGLDPINTNLIKDEIYQLRESGSSVIFSTHRMEQVEEICERIVLVSQGKKILEGDVDQIKNDFKENIYKIEFEGNLPEDISGHFKVLSDTDKELLIKADEDASPNLLLKEIMDRGFVIKSFNEVLPSLNEIFIKQVEGKSNE